MDNLQFVPFTGCTMKATVIAGTTSTLSSTGTVYFGIRGKAYSHAALSNTATPTTDVNTGLAYVPVTTNTGCVFVIGFNAAGTLLAAQGGLQALDAAGLFTISPQFPILPDNFAPIAYQVIKAGSTAAAAGWVFGTGNQASVTGITYTIVDVMGLPDRPQIS